MVNLEESKVNNSIEGDNIKVIILRYLRYWYLFLFFILVSACLSYFYLKYQKYVYSTSTKIKILDDNEGGLDLSGLNGAKSLFNYNKVNLDNEIQVFKSRRLLKLVIDDLNLNTFHYESGSFKDQVVFGKSLPFQVNWVEEGSYEADDYPKLKLLDRTKFKFLGATSSEGKIFNYGDTINYLNSKFTITPNVNFEDYNNHKNDIYYFKFIDDKYLIDILSEQIKIEPVGDRSDILKASIKGTNKERNEAILNTLVSQFNLDGIEDKRLVSKRTEEFVEERLNFLVQELDTVESDIVDFKEDNNVVTVESSVEQLFTKEATSESERFAIATQIEVANAFKELLEEGNEYQLLPANIGIESVTVNELTADYNEIISQRNRLLVSSTEKNPMVESLNNKIDNIRNNIRVSLDNYLRGLNISYNNLQNREGNFKGQISNLPKKEKELRKIIRQQGVKERLYLFLLQKREEAALSFAVTAPTIKVVDYAFTNDVPISPRKRVIFLGSIIFGFVFPFGLLYLKFLLDTNVSSREEIETKLPNIPILGEIPMLSNSDEKLIQKNDNSVLAESFRILRTNLFHYYKNTSSSIQVVYVTSSIKGEGKTFTAINLARTIASSNKKVLLIGADLRNPQIHTYFNTDRNILGLSDYIAKNNVDYKGYLRKQITNFENLDIMFSGSVPPNAAELLLEDNFKDLLHKAKQDYDYIIVDTAPTIYVTDTFLIAKEADVTLYMVKEGLTEKKLLKHIEDVNRSKKISNLSLILNGASLNTNFGYGYGYVYTDKKKPFYKFW